MLLCQVFGQMETSLVTPRGYPKERMNGEEKSRFDSRSAGVDRSLYFSPVGFEQSLYGARFQRTYGIPIVFQGDSRLGGESFYHPTGEKE